MCWLNMPANLENSTGATGLEKVSFHSSPKEDNAKESSNYSTIAFISHTSKVMLKILQVRHQQYMNNEIPDVQAGFRKDRGTREQIAKEYVKAVYCHPAYLTHMQSTSCEMKCWAGWSTSWNQVGSLKKQESSRKTSTSALWTMPKSLTMWITTNWKILKETGLPDHLTWLLRNLCAGQL